jgi:hypothetical protein
MQNPSTANEAIADKSVQFLEKLTFQKSTQELVTAYRLIIVNQFAYVQTRGFAGMSSDVGPDNDSHVRNAIAESDIVIVAWGKTNRYKDRQTVIENILRQFTNLRLYETAKHPSRGFYDNFLRPIRI